MKKLALALILFPIFSSFGQVDVTRQISEAIMAAPEEEQKDCTVLGYTVNGDLQVIRQGKNKTICLADNPAQKGFSVACYHTDLEPFMARGRALKLAGKTANEIFEMRESEAISGQLKMPDKPTTLHILSGDTLGDANYRWVVYIPFATAESTGLPLKPIVPGAPWIMDPGTHRAHIMITPPPKD